MPRRDVVFANNEIYHIFNRSVGREHIFVNLHTLKHVKECIGYYQYSQELKFSKFRSLNKEAKDDYILQMNLKSPLVEVYAFSFMPNHFHFLIKQLKNDGIKHFITNFQISFAKYYNTRFERTGSLFENPFKGKLVQTDEEFMHISRYIHLNHVTAYLVQFDQLLNYPWCSFGDYINGNKTKWLNTHFLLEMFPSVDVYREFVADQVDYQRTLADLKYLVIE